MLIHILKHLGANDKRESIETLIDDVFFRLPGAVTRGRQFEGPGGERFPRLSRIFIQAIDSFQTGTLSAPARSMDVLFGNSPLNCLGQNFSSHSHLGMMGSISSSRWSLRRATHRFANADVGRQELLCSNPFLICQLQNAPHLTGPWSHFQKFRNYVTPLQVGHNSGLPRYSRRGPRVDQMLT